MLTVDLGWYAATSLPLPMYFPNSHYVSKDLAMASLPPSPSRANQGLSGSLHHRMMRSSWTLSWMD